MAFSLSGSVITQTGTETPAGLVTAGFATYVGANALKVIELSNNHKLKIDGAFDDSGWTILYPSGSYFILGSNGVWKSGKDISDSHLDGAKHILENTGLSWSVNSQIETGGRLEWFGTQVICKGAGFLQFIDNTASSQSHIIKNVTLDLSGTTYFWMLGDLKVTSDSYIILNRVNLSLKGSGSFPSLRYWTAATSSADASILPDDALNPAAVTLNNINANFDDASIQKLALSNHGTKTVTYTLKNPAISESAFIMTSNARVNTVTTLKFENTFDVNVKDLLSGSNISSAKVILLNGSTQRALGVTNAVGDYSVDIETYSKTADTGASAVNISTITPTINNRINTSIRVISFNHNYSTFLSSSVVGVRAYNFNLSPDLNITQVNKTTVDAYTEIETAQKLYDRAKSWLVDNYTGQTSTILSRNGDSIDLNALNIVVDKTAANAFAFNGTTITIKADSFSGNLLTTGTITASNGAVITGSIEDSLGVRVTFNLSGSSAFNLLVRREDTGAELGHETGITSFTYTLPRNITLRYALWREGSDTLYGTYDTSNGGAIITPSPLINDAIDTSVNVTSTLANISTTYSSGNFNIDFGAATSLSLENFKVVMHHLLGGEAAMQYLINNAGTQAFFIKTDELKVTQPKLILIRNASVSSSDVVEILAFINFDDAQTVQAQLNAAAVAAGGSATNYVPDPPTAAGLRVAYLKVKPAIDADQLARTTAALIDPSISQAIDHARAANIQTQ